MKKDVKKPFLSIKDKRGISVMIGYILLISISIVISIIVYQWISTYVPRGSLGCNEGVSLFVERYVYSCGADQLNLTLRNNGKFDIAGYFIHATTTNAQELAVTDLSGSTPNGKGGSVHWETGQDFNAISSGESITDVFDLTTLSECSGGGRCIFSLEIIPIRYEVLENKNRPVSCSEAKIREPMFCSTSISCGDDSINDPAEYCDGTDWGTITGCSDLGYTGGILSCYPAGTQNECTFDTSSCTSGNSCDGTWSPPEDTGVECDGTPLPTNCLADCTCGAGYTSDGSGGCVGAPDLVLSITGVSKPNNKDIQINFKIENIGTTDAGSFQWKVNDSITPATNDPQTGTITYLIQPSNFIDMTTTLTYQTPTDIINATLTVDYTFIVNELSETNNEITTSIDCSSGICSWT